MIKTIIHVNDRGRSESYVLEEFRKNRVEIGRSAESDIVVGSERVGRHHGCFVRNHEEWEYMDLDSTNGSWINGREIDSCMLVEGREICLGRERGQDTVKFDVRITNEPDKKEMNDPNKTVKCDPEEKVIREPEKKVVREQDESDQNKQVVSQEQQKAYSNMGEKYQGQGQAPKEKTSGLAIASMVIGIIAVVASFSWSILTSPVILGILALLAILFSISPLSKKRKGKGMAVAGLICGLVALFRVVYLWVNVANLLGNSKNWF